MAWIEVHQSLPHHPKTKRLARALSLPIYGAVGLMVNVWAWALDYAQDGNLSRFDDEELADGAQWDGEPSELRAAMLKVGFLDSTGVLHDWWDYAGKLVEKRQANAKRMRDARAKHKGDACDARATNVQDTCADTSDARAGLPYRTVPNPTEQNQHHHAHEHEHAHALDGGGDLSELELFWARLKGRNPPFARGEYDAMRECLAALPLDKVKESVAQQYEARKAKGDPPVAFQYFVAGVKREAERLGLIAKPIEKAVPPAPKVPEKPRIANRAQYEALIQAEMLNPDDWANPDEFADQEGVTA